MVLQSGQPPYDYAHGKGPFKAMRPYSSDYPSAPSGILLEQAQFVITAEIRKFVRFDGNEGSHTLPLFNIYTNVVITPSGPYEPKTNGSTLGNQLNPGGLSFIDHIQETRVALETLFGFIESPITDYKAAWLEALYANNASGQLGEYVRRLPSETGPIEYTLLDVLGGSGVLFDVDFGEVLFNPPPNIAGFGNDDAHGPAAVGITDLFSIQQYPFFPAFQKTDGTLIPLTGREPLFLNGVPNYFTDPISSGTIGLYGYCLKPLTKFYVSQGLIFNAAGTPAFTVFAESIREVFTISGNVETSKVFITPTAQASGLHRVAAVNKFTDFPTTTIESGRMSQWPAFNNPFAISYPTVGYHVFDDALWVTDRYAQGAAVGGPNRGLPSGLATLSPYTSDPLWVRYADLTEIASLEGFGVNPVYTSGNWSKFVGLERQGGDQVYRLHPTIQRPFSTNSGQFRLGRWNDELDLVTDITTTSAFPIAGPLSNQFPLGGNTDLVNDFWFDGTSYWVSNQNFAQFDLWEFDASFDYQAKYILTVSGISNARGFADGGQNYLFRGTLGNPAANQTINSSGIYPMSILTPDPAPFSSDVTMVGEVQLGTPKFINAAAHVGAAIQAEIMDMVSVPSATHLTPGIYALVRWRFVAGNGGNVYLLRLEEAANSWEIRYIKQLFSTLNNDAVRYEFLHMDY